MQSQTIRLYLHAGRRYPWLLACSLINPIITVITASFIGPFIIAMVFDQLQAGTVSLAASWPLIGYYTLTQLYGEVIGWRLTLFTSWRMETAIQRDFHGRIFQQLSRQSLHFHNNRFGGSLVSQTSKFIAASERFYDTLVFNLIPVITSIFAASIILSFVFWQYALFLFVVSVIFFMTVILSSRFMARLNTLEAQASTKLTGRLADVITNISAMKSFGRENQELSAYETLVTEWRGRSLASMWGFLGVSSAYSFLLMVLNVGALIAALVATEQKIVAAGTVYLSITYTFTVARQLWEINNITRNFNRVMGDAHDMTEILAIEPSVRDSSQTYAVQPHSGAITFDNVTFTHTEDGKNGDKDAALFKNFSLQIAPGERVGLVGHSGSGKTTLTRLLLRFMDIDSGRIAIDGQSIDRLPQSLLRQAIAYVPQEPLLFHRTLRENIAYGKPEATEKEIEEAALKAHATEFIAKLPQGLDTLVGERGVKLSGGQRQRIAIARAILKDAPILVLDEATSALDSVSEKMIQVALAEAMKNRTTIVIAHRLSTIQKMDRIIVLSNGYITEQGSHSELLRKNGVYSQLWQHQSGGFIEE